MGFWELLFPARCVGCGQVGAYLCVDCVNQVREIREPICPMCGGKSIGGRTHARCKKPWGMEGLVSGFNHVGVGKRLITSYKYRLVAQAREALGELVISFMALDYLPKRSWVLVPVPLHPRRERWRGFNQSRLLAGEVAAMMEWQVMEALIRTKHTKHQQGLSRNARLANIRGAFGVVQGIDLRGSNLLLVDDVWTTGATMRECAKVLKRVGVREVWGLVAARPERNTR